MSRWGIENPMRDAFLFALDPETEGEPFSHEEQREAERDVARMQILQILEGLGYLDLVGHEREFQTPTTPVPRRAAGVELEGESKKTFLGAVASPFGILPVSIEEARNLSLSLPGAIADKFRFVGLDTDVVLSMRSHQAIEPRSPRVEEDGTTIGPDGLLFAPLGRVVSRAVEI